jgi:hypothetical protein
MQKMSGASGPRGSVPEPKPLPLGEVVPIRLIAELEELRNQTQSMHNLTDLIILVEERNAFGMAKYGQPLMTRDGRNGIEDARQELGDLLQYVCKCAMANEEGLEEFVELMSTALFVVKQMCAISSENTQQRKP